MGETGNGPKGTVTMLDGLLTRNSVPPRLVDQAPVPQADIDDMLAAAVRAPDHGAVRPWRFHVIAGDARAKLGDLYAEAMRRRDPQANPDTIEKERERAFRAPLTIAVCAEVDPSRGEKVPVAEQIASAAAACQNILLAAHAKGYGAIWVTGPRARDAHVKGAFGLAEKDEIVGFIYVGRPSTPVPDKPRPDAQSLTTIW